MLPTDAQGVRRSGARGTDSWPGLNITGQVCGTPIFAHVNWFQRDHADGHYLWPGYRDAGARGVSVGWSPSERSAAPGVGELKQTRRRWRAAGWSGVVNDPRA